MNVPTEIVVAFLSAFFALQGWTLLEITRLKVKVALLTQRVFHHGGEDEEEDL
jgi:hypothetical protein